MATIARVDGTGSRAGDAGSAPQGRGLWIVLGIVGALRAAYLALYAHGFPLYRAPLVDAKIYDDWARAILAGDLLGRGEGVFYRAPLYPYLLAGLMRIFGNALPWIAILQLVLGLFTVLFAAKLSARIGGSRAAVATALLLGLYGPMMAAESKLLATSLGLFLHLAALLAALRHREAPSAGRGWLAGLLLGLACLVRPQWLVLALLVPIVIAWPGRVVLSAPRRWSSWLRPWTPFWLGLVVIVAPIAIRNRVIGHDAVLISSNGGMTFFQGNNEENSSGLLTIVKKFDLFGSATEQRVLETRVAERETGRSLKPSETSRFWTDQALRFITGHPGAWLTLEARKLYRFVTGYEYADNYSFYIEQGRLWPVKLAFIPFGLLLACGVAGLLPPWIGDRAALRLTLLSASVGFLGCMAFYVSSRYRMEVAPALAVAGGVWIARLLESVRHRAPWPRVAGVVALLVLLASFLPAGAPARSQESITWLQVGNAYENSKRPEDARGAYQRAIDLLPENVFAWNNLILLVSRQDSAEKAFALLEKVPPSGQEHPMTLYLKGHLLARLEREDEAVSAYEEAIRQNPLLKEAHFNLALIYEKRRDYERAAEHLEEARRLGDQTPELLSHLGYIRLQERRYDDARELLSDLLAKKPEDDEARFNLAVCEFYLGDLDAMATRLEELRRRSGEDGLLLYYRGLLELRRRQLESASADLSRALAQSSENARALYYLAQARGGQSLDLKAWETTYGSISPALAHDLESWFRARSSESWGAPIEGEAAVALAALSARPETAALVFDLRRFAEEEAAPRP